MRRYCLTLGLVLGGCAGYSVGPIKPTFMKQVHKVSVPIFVNDTYEPNIESLITSIMIKQIQQDGTYEVVGRDQADAEVKGSLLEVDRVKDRAVIGNVLASAEVNLVLRVRIQVVNPANGAVLGQRDVLGQTSYFVGNDIATQERQAVPLAARDVATQAVSYLSEGW